MTDRDALIERVTTLVDRAHGVATVVVYVADLKALISLASPSPFIKGYFTDRVEAGDRPPVSPSPAQTRIEVGKPMPPDCPACGSIPVAGHCDLAGCPLRALGDREAGEWVNRGEGWEWISTSPAQTEPWLKQSIQAGSDFVERNPEWSKTMSDNWLKPGSPPSPAQWPEDVVERAERARDATGWTLIDQCNAGDNETFQAWAFEDRKHRLAAMRAALATLPPPEERVQRMEQQLRACQLLAGDAIGDYPEGTPEFEIFADIHLAAVRGLLGSLEVTNEAEGIPLPPPEEESDGFATKLIQWLEARGHNFPEGLDADTAISLLDDHEAALTAPDERVKRLVSALERSRNGWENVIELGLLPERHRHTARVLENECHSALASYRGGE